MIEELKARIAEYERHQAVLIKALNHTAQYIAWREFGECRGFDAAIATPAQVIEIARAALAAVKPAACKNSDSWNCKYCRMTKDCAAIVDPRNYGVPVKPAGQEVGE
jgi:hypothetical protein